MKSAMDNTLKNIGIGLVIVIPLYLSFILVIKAINMLRELVRPIVDILPRSFQHEGLAAFLALLLICLIIGKLTHTATGNRIKDRIEHSIFKHIPGYTIFKSIASRIAGEQTDNQWQPALIDTDDNALMPAFIIEELSDGRYTVFVPSVPTPLAGSVFIFARERVHPVNISFTQAVKVVSHWGEGAKDMVLAMEKDSNYRHG